MSHRTRRSYRTMIALAAAATVVLAAAAACGDEDLDLPPPPASPAPTTDNTPESNLDPADAADAEEILAAFDSYMEGYVELTQEGVLGGTDETMDRLEEIHVAAEAFDELAFEILTPNAQAGHATSGTLGWEAQVREIDWEHSFEYSDDVIPRAIIDACIDETDWTTIEVDSGEVVDGPGSRYTSEIWVTWWEADEYSEQEDRWHVSFRYDDDAPC
ncbi:hypothetical protein JQS43_16765 [Natronosporangium hydrolyticum]|uniref:Nuclear transport factor 2 family protein n=1 Tax=Natronosporangium hydrolyticum TaxID=2811111 RepID=A0A895Y6B6_9ACTN|nr:hypothetical protein [Natronosporangium hydrolyticum]QSB13274.1 hypothetical protein JQS43_16765 [Natronosporangium hydrolyticum]